MLPNYLGLCRAFPVLIIYSILFPGNVSASDCLIPEKLAGLQPDRDIEAHVISDKEVYITAGSKLYRLGVADPIDELENDHYISVYQAGPGLLLVTDKHLRLRISSTETRTLPGEPLADKLVNVYQSETYGTLLNFSGDLYQFDEKDLTRTILITSEGGITNSCVAADAGFVAAIGDKIFYLEKEGSTIQAVPMPGFNGLCNDLKRIGNEFLVSGYDTGFSKANSVDKRFEKIPGEFDGTAWGIHTINGKTLLSTTTALYLLSEDGEIVPIQNGKIGLLEDLFSVSNQIVLHSIRGLYSWNDKDSIQSVLEADSDLLRTFKSDQAIYIQKGQDLYRFGNQGLKNIKIDHSPNEQSALNLRIVSVLDLDAGPLFATNAGVFHLDPNGGRISRLLGSPEKPVTQLFKTELGAFAVSDKRLYRVRKSGPLNADIFTNISTVSIHGSNVGEKLKVIFGLNHEKHPCASYTAWINPRIELRGTGQDPQTIPVHRMPSDHLKQENFSMFESSLISNSRDTNIEIVGQNPHGDNIRILVKMEKSLLEYLGELGGILSEKNVLIYLTVIFISFQLVFARYSQWSFNFCFNLFSGTPFEKKINPWTHLVLRITPYRHWLFRRYFDYMRARALKTPKVTLLDIHFVKAVSSSNPTLGMEDILSKLQNAKKNIWIYDKDDLLGPNLNDTLISQFFVKRSRSQVWRDFHFLPIFISGKSGRISSDTSWLVTQARKEFKRAKLDFRDSDSFERMLESGELAIIIDGLNDQSQEIRKQIIRYSINAPAVRLLVKSKLVEDDIADLFDIYTPVSTKSVPA